MNAVIAWANVFEEADFQPHGKFYSGIHYTDCDDFEYWEAPNGDTTALYMRAVQATQHVSQSDHVEIYWLGSLAGTLKGQC